MKSWHLRYLILIFVIPMTVNVLESVSADMNGPWEPVDSFPDPHITYEQTILHGIKAIYGTVHSGISRGCPSYPSCSTYMFRAMSTHGLITGYILGLERLFHESGEIRHGQLIYVDGEVKVLDTLANNTFWWNKNEKK